MKVIVAVLLTSLVSAGCAVDQWDGVTYVDERFSPTEQTAIQEAADMWADATGGVVHFNLVFGEHLPPNPTVDAIVRADRDNLPPVLSDADAFGFSDPYTRTITIAPETCGSPVCFAHELGHSAGLIHIEGEPAAIMDPYVAGKCITRRDIAMACKVNHHDCTGRALKPCD
jgi:hypothetical protein